MFDAGVEEFPAEHPFSNDGVYDGGDDLYSGVNCAHSTLCSPNQVVTIWATTSIVMSTSTPIEGSILLLVDGVATALGSTINIANQASVNLEITVADQNGNALADGTSVTLDAGNGTLSDSNFTVGEQRGPSTFSTVLTGDNTSSSGNLTLRTESPSGRESASIILLDVDD